MTTLGNQVLQNFKNNPFPSDFLWGVATAGHQIEGNNTNSDIWLFENTKPSVFRQRSADACNSFELWEIDLDLAKDLGLTCYRFSLEWARIEPEKGHFSKVMLNHYRAIIDGCHQRGMKAVVTFNHFSSPIWFIAKGGWANPKAADYFELFCKRVAEEFGDSIDFAMTINEPNILRLLKVSCTFEEIWTMQGDMLEQVEKKFGIDKISGLNASRLEDLDLMLDNLIESHKRGRDAIKSVCPTLPVGLSLAMLDDQAQGENSLRDVKCDDNYGAWFQVAQTDADFIGVQNYERVVWDENGMIERPADSMTNCSNAWIDPTSLANAVRFTYEVTGKPIFVTEHGIGTDIDEDRSRFLTESLVELQKTIQEGIPVIGYVHWTLLDNFEWIHGFDMHFGLHSVDLDTFERKRKPSADVYKAIIEVNSKQETESV